MVVFCNPSYGRSYRLDDSGMRLALDKNMRPYPKEIKNKGLGA
jgi:hypothetical protein